MPMATHLDRPLTAYILGTKSRYRGDHLERELRESNIKYENVWGQDCQSADPSQLLSTVEMDKVHFLLNRSLTLGEICCANGHISIYREFLKSEDDWTLILEDDAELCSLIFPTEIIKRTIEKQPSIIQLYGLKEVLTQAGIKGPNFQIKGDGKSQLVKLHFIPELTHAYLINRRAASKLLQSVKKGVHSTADWPILGLRGVHFYSVVEPIFTTLNNQSLLEFDRKNIVPINRFKKRHISLLVQSIGILAIIGSFKKMNLINLQSYYFKQVRTQLCRKKLGNFLYRSV